MDVPMNAEAPNPADQAERDRRAAAHDWLMQSASHRHRAGLEWTYSGVAVLTAGVTWDVVKMPYAAFDPRFDWNTPAKELRQRLEELEVAGPAFCDPYRPYVYALVPPGTDRKWPQDLTAAGHECLGGTRPFVHHVAIPSLNRSEPPGLFWLTLPDPLGEHPHVDPGHLCKVLRGRAAPTDAAITSATP
ncbi:hypothetical protein ABZ619_38665 [Streptomyces sp. NPDC007851]|uniref:hypothetical protein n=1 Tax=Streptomyces sp. NPDC007851 TaxID=3155008 RepID=UPI0033DB924B